MENEEPPPYEECCAQPNRGILNYQQKDYTLMQPPSGAHSQQGGSQARNQFQGYQPAPPYDATQHQHGYSLSENHPRNFQLNQEYVHANTHTEGYQLPIQGQGHRLQQGAFTQQPIPMGVMSMGQVQGKLSYQKMMIIQ